jgi:branched-subunit amino acid aminotransferase/4-amino-4-deoxychorismate lyase
MGAASSTASFRCWHWIGEGIVPLRGGIPLSDRGFRYGEHLFESLAVRRGRVLLAREHLALLREAAARRRFPFPKGLPSALSRFFRDTASRLSDGMIRIYLTAGPGAPASPVHSPAFFITWEGTPFPTVADLERGYALATLEGRAGESWGEASVPWGEKSGNYLHHCDALREARQTGADEGLVTDQRGHAVSCTMGNLLVWMRMGKALRVFTPPPSSGARRGALLGWVRGRINVVERDLSGRDLSKVIAMAVTNSRIGVMPVVSLDGSPMPDLASPRELALRYRQHVSP